jgi:hypothetical protein
MDEAQVHELINNIDTCREMENINRDSTFRGFSHYPHREVDAGRHS